MKFRRPRLLIGASVAVLVVAGGGFAARRFWGGRGPLTVLPTFVEPGPGRRAPRSDLLGLVVGRTSLTETRAALAGRGLQCPDTSMRALMKEMREAKLRDVQERERLGKAPDAVTGASAMNRPSPKERNPQVRLSCEPVQAQRLADRPRASAPGRWLIVFDSPDHPLRHTSFERTHHLVPEASADLRDSVAALTARFGPPTKSADPTRARDLPWLSPAEWEWRFADLLVRVVGLNYGTRGVNVSETIEVPWPVRPTAPADAVPREQPVALTTGG